MMGRPIKVAFVLHVMQVAGAEVLVAETIRRLKASVDSVIFCLDAKGQLGEIMQKEGVPVVALGRKPGLDWHVSKRLAREVIRCGIEIVHAHQYTPFFYAALAKLRSRGRFSLIFTEHGRHYPDMVSSKRRLLNRLLLSRVADEVNAVCEFSARALRQNDGFEGCPIDVIQNGIQVDRYPPATDRAALRRRLGLQPHRRYISCIARFHPVKDHATLLRAFAATAPGHPDTDLLLIGDGPLRPDLEHLSAKLGLLERVRFLGIRTDVPDLLRASDVFILTSVSEAASLTLLEAMAASLPVVVTRVGGNPEIVRENLDGLLVPQSHSAAAAAALDRILRDPGLAMRLGASARARVLASYPLERTIQRYCELYEALAARPRRFFRAQPS